VSVSSRLGLGTAQWGVPRYGVAGSGRPTAETVAEMLRLGRTHGIDLLDTAHAYGDAEAVIGGVQSCVGDELRIVTKTMAVRAPRISIEAVTAVVAAFAGSLTRLRRQRVYGLLVHHSNDLLAQGGDRLWAAMEDLRSEGKVAKIGVSVYDPEQLEAIVQRYAPTLVQLPLSVYDRRFERTVLLAALKRADIEVHARSAFLQGLLLLGADELPLYFAPIRAHHASFHAHVRALGVSPLAACLGFCLAQASVDRVIVGCEALEQLAEIIAAAEAAGSPDLPLDVDSLDDAQFLDPSRWPQGESAAVVPRC